MVINNHTARGLAIRVHSLRLIDDRIDELMTKAKIRIEFEVTANEKTIDPKKEKEQIEQVFDVFLEKLHSGTYPEIHSDEIIG